VCHAGPLMSLDHRTHPSETGCYQRVTTEPGLSCAPGVVTAVRVRFDNRLVISGNAPPRGEDAQTRTLDGWREADRRYSPSATSACPWLAAFPW